MLSGSTLIAFALTGMVEARGPNPLLFYTYTLSSSVNAIAGILLVPKAPLDARGAFYSGGIMQLALLYFAWRFFEIQEMDGYAVWLLLDKCFAVSILVSICYMVYIVWSGVRNKLGTLSAVSVSVGCFSLMLLAGYPLQLAFAGQEWYLCVLNEFPLQRAGFVNYVYVPATWTLGGMFFGATLLTRKIISVQVFAAFFLGLILATLFSTVILQEVHIPCVSTQRLLLFCPSNDLTELQQIASRVLDTSRLAQSMLKRAFPQTNFKFEKC